MGVDGVVGVGGGSDGIKRSISGAAVVRTQHAAADDGVGEVGDASGRAGAHPLHWWVRVAIFALSLAYEGLVEAAAVRSFVDAPTCVRPRCVREKRASRGEEGVRRRGCDCD